MAGCKTAAFDVERRNGKLQQELRNMLNKRKGESETKTKTEKDKDK